MRSGKFDGARQMSRGERRRDVNEEDIGGGVYILSEAA